MVKENKQTLLRRLGTLPLILFWLAIEYIAFSLGYNFFLGNLLSGKEEWIRWAQYTGLGGVSFWILISAFLLYITLFKKWQYAVVLVIVIVGPILYSYTLQSSAGMVAQNEWVGRSAAWISVLILISTIVKEFTRKK